MFSPMPEDTVYAASNGSLTIVFCPRGDGFTLNSLQQPITVEWRSITLGGTVLAHRSYQVGENIEIASPLTGPMFAILRQNT